MSLRLKSRRNAAPNGFDFKQNETGWYLQTWDFFELCRELQKHRLANPQFKLNTNMAAIEDEVDEFNALRVSKIPMTESYLMDGGASPPFPVPQHRSLGQKLRNVADKSRILIDWLADGAKPVDQSVAEERAAVCVKCPLNGKSPLTDFFTVPIAALIHKTIEKKQSMNLRTSLDDELGTCQACKCPMALKVWVPIDYIVKKTDTETRDRLDRSCWILSESSEA